eukprot:895056-Pyramimonas_sp.AAC.1
MFDYLGPCWMPSWTPRGPPGAILGHLVRSNPSRAPWSDPGEGAGRGVLPSPEQGKGGFGAARRRTLVSQLRQEDWWDCGRTQPGSPVSI